MIVLPLLALLEEEQHVREDEQPLTINVAPSGPHLVTRPRLANDFGNPLSVIVSMVCRNGKPGPEPAYGIPCPLDGLMLGTFDVQLDEVHPLKTKLGDKAVYRRHRNTLNLGIILRIENDSVPSREMWVRLEGESLFSVPHTFRVNHDAAGPNLFGEIAFEAHDILWRGFNGDNDTGS